MLLLALVPLCVALAGALTSRAVAQRLAPALATVLLTALALSVALVTGLLLCLGGVVAFAEEPSINDSRRWAPWVLRDTIPLPPALGVAGAATAGLLLAAATVHAARVVHRARCTAALIGQLPPPAGDLVLVDDAEIFAYSVPGRAQRIVASTGMVKALSGAQRRAVLAHEDAHLRHRHHLYLRLGRLAAVANPLMRPVAQSIELAVERWADEEAARVVGDRTTVAEALGAAALARPRLPAGTLAATRSHVVERVRALLTPLPRGRACAVTVVAALAASWIATAVVVDRVHALLELAETVAAR